MAGIRINKIVDASSEYQRWGLRIGHDETRKMVSGKLPCPLKVLSHLPGPAKVMMDGIVQNAPQVRYMAKHTDSKTHDPALPMIRTAVEMLFSEQKPDGSGTYTPDDFDALIISGGPFRAGDPSPMLRVMSELDSHGVISERMMSGKMPHSEPWYVDVLSEGCVSWIKALRRVEDLISSGKIKSAIVVNFGMPSGYIDDHRLYELSNHADGASACAIQGEEESSQIVFGEKRKILKISDEGNGNRESRSKRNGKPTAGKSEIVFHNFNPPGLSLIEQFSFSPATCLEKLDDSQNSSDFIASQCAKSLIQMSEQRGIPLDQFDAILLPQVSETFLDKVETFLATDFRKKLSLKLHIRDDLRGIVQAYCPSFDEYQKTTNKPKQEICRNFCEVIKQSEKPNSSGELYQRFLSQLTADELRLFNYMRDIHSKNFRTYQEAGYTTSNSIPGGLALGVQNGKFGLGSEIAIASGSLGYSFDSLTMNVPLAQTTTVDPNADTTIDLPVPVSASRWKNRARVAVKGVREALRVVGLSKVFPML